MSEGCLVVSQKKSDEVVIDLREFGLGLIIVSPTEIRGDKVRIAYRARKDIPIHRRSVFDAIEDQKRAA